MQLVSIRYSIPIFIVLFTAGLAAYTVQRDIESAEAIVRGEAVSHLMNRMTALQRIFSQTVSHGNFKKVEEQLELLNESAGPQFAMLADDTAKVMTSTDGKWTGEFLYQTAGVDWHAWLNEPLQVVVERVRRQQSGELLLLGAGRYILGVYPVSLDDVGHRTGVLIVQKDLTRDLSLARRTVEQHTLEMVGLLVLLAFVLGILVHFFLSRRLNQLVAVTERFAAGEFDARARPFGRDEVARLGAAFNRMAAQVSDSHKGLEARVQARTAELASTVGELQNEIAERSRIECALFDEKERIQITLSSIGDAVITTDLNGRIDYVNPVAEKLAGAARDSILGRPFGEVFHFVDEVNRLPLLDPVQLCLAQNKTIELSKSVLLSRHDSMEQSIDISAAPIHDRNNNVIGVVLICRDVTEMHRVTQELSYQASHDSMTGLINRMEFERRLQRVLSTARADESHALLYLDLDQFKIVNDTCGHVAGDELLRQVSALLAQKVRKHDTVARLGGDEFGLLLEDCVAEQALHIAHEIRTAVLSYSFIWEERNFRIGASIGLVPIKPGLDTLASIFKTADSACYAAKEQGRNRVHVYETDDIELAQRHGEMQWIPRIQEALLKNQFALFFQPIVPLNSIHGLHYEVLLRMVDTNGELMQPSVFIPVAERYDQMQAIDRWVVQKAFGMLNDPEIIPEHIGISINLSGQSLSDSHFLEFVENEVASKNVPLERVCFEITETAAIGNLIHAQRFFSVLKERGCRFALDDFGSGLSSFAYLKNLPVDFLKIDGAFVKDMANDPIDCAMVEAIHKIGHVMGIETIAEFVETVGILDLLKSIGVNYAQGHFLANPKPLVASPPNSDIPKSDNNT